MSYGFKVNRADGTEQLGPTNTVLRHIATETFLFDDIAARSIPQVNEAAIVVQWTTGSGPEAGIWYVNPWDTPSITVSGSGTISVSPPASNVGRVETSYSVSVYEYG